MGKARKLKLIRKAAAMLPAMEGKAFVNEKLMGYKLIEDGINEAKGGEKIDPKKLYVKRSAVPVAVNHNRQMKALYNRHGMAGAIAYAKQVEKAKD